MEFFLDVIHHLVRQFEVASLHFLMHHPYFASTHDLPAPGVPPFLLFDGFKRAKGQCFGQVVVEVTVAFDIFEWLEVFGHFALVEACLVERLGKERGREVVLRVVLRKNAKGEHYKGQQVDQECEAVSLRVLEVLIGNRNLILLVALAFKHLEPFFEVVHHCVQLFVCLVFFVVLLFLLRFFLLLPKFALEVP